MPIPEYMQLWMHTEIAPQKNLKAENTSDDEIHLSGRVQKQKHKQHQQADVGCLWY